MSFGVVPKLDRYQKLKLAIEGSVYVDMMQPPGYRAPVPVYVVCCPKHGLYLDTPHGFTKRFDCDKCLSEFERELEAKVVG